MRNCSNPKICIRGGGVSTEDAAEIATETQSHTEAVTSTSTLRHIVQLTKKRDILTDAMSRGLKLTKPRNRLVTTAGRRKDGCWRFGCRQQKESVQSPFSRVPHAGNEHKMQALSCEGWICIGIGQEVFST